MGKCRGRRAWKREGKVFKEQHGEESRKQGEVINAKY